MFTGIHHASFAVSNMDKSIAFYRDIIGMKLTWDSKEAGVVFEGPVSDAVTGCPGTKQRIAFLALGNDILELVEYTPTGKPRLKITNRAIREAPISASRRTTFRKFTTNWWRPTCACTVPRRITEKPW